MPQHIKGVIGLQHGVGRHCLLNARAEYGMVGTPHLEYGDAILVAYVEFAHGHALKVHAAALSLESEHEVGNVILVQQVGQRVVGAAVGSLTRLFAKHKAAKGVEQDKAHRTANDADWQKVEEGKALASVVAQIAVDNKVGRCAYQGEYATHRAGKGQRHHEFGRTGAGAFGHGQNDGQQQGHRAGVAHKGRHHAGVPIWCAPNPFETRRRPLQTGQSS